MNDQTPVPMQPVPIERATGMKISLGGVILDSFQDVMDLARAMSISGPAVSKVCRGNPGICLAVIYLAHEWQLSPFQVGKLVYEVNGELGYMSQLIHAVIEARAPLTERLNCEYEGEGENRRCTVVGEFRGVGGKTYKRSYTTPKLKDIKPKNSPLWASDPDQQLFYRGTLMWARKWTPDVVMGIYTGEELSENPSLSGREPEAGLHARLIGGKVDKTKGHNAEEVARNIEIIDQGSSESAAQIYPDAEKSDESGTTAVADDGVVADGKGDAKTPKRRKKAEAKEKEPIKEPEQQETPAQESKRLEPKTPAEWKAYATGWLKETKDYNAVRERWASERALRNRCGVTAEFREDVVKFMDKRLEELK